MKQECKAPCDKGQELQMLHLMCPSLFLGGWQPLKFSQGSYGTLNKHRLNLPLLARKSKPLKHDDVYTYVMGTKVSPYRSYHNDYNPHFLFLLEKKIQWTPSLLTIILPAYLLWTPALFVLVISLSTFHVHKTAFAICILLRSMGFLCLTDPKASKVACPDTYRIIISSLKSCHTFC